jgi:hypothetical protein
MMLLDILSTLFLTHVGNLTTVKSNQRRFAPTPAHITGIRMLALKDGELLAKGEVFEHQTAARPKPAKSTAPSQSRNRSNMVTKL